jgi:nitroimidazol reductase NimA-like FMN-containing flavoprotein (pyridoxamine 5'-phosphate oxidase superfamily)
MGHVELRPIPEDECTLLLAAGSVGRVGLSQGALPVVLPVNYAVLDGDIVIRTGAGTKLDAALTNAVVAFEIDAVDPVYHEGWSVMVQGRAHEVVDPEELKRARALPLEPWAAGARDRFVRIASERMSGRRIALPNGNGNGTQGSG